MEAGFVESLGLMIVAAALLAWATRQARMPSVVGYLLAGLALGPWLGLVHLTPATDVISKTGIVLLLFLVGLELSLEKIRGLGRLVLVASLVQMGATALGGYAIARALGYSNTEAWWLGVILSFSSTVLAVKLLGERGELTALYGRLSVGVLVLQDLVVIALLAVLPGLEAQANFSLRTAAWPMAKSVGGMGLLIVLVMGVTHRGLPRPFAWAARSPSTLFMWSLCWCFLVMAAARAMELSAEAGAFLAGLGLAQLPYNKDMHRRVQPLMNFCIAIFFVSVGMEMEPERLTGSWKVVAALLAFAVAGKFLILLGTLAALGIGERSAHHTALTLAQISEFSLILSVVLARAGCIEANTANLVGMIGLPAMAVSACLVQYKDPLFRALRWLGLPRLLRARSEPKEAAVTEWRRDHIIVVGMNTLGRRIAQSLHERGEQVLAIDTDPAKLVGLPCATLLGDIEYSSVLEEAGLASAKLAVSALRIEPTNDLLAFRCRQARVPCAIHLVDVSTVDTLLEMNVACLMIPKVDGIRLQTEELKRRGFLSA